MIDDYRKNLITEYIVEIWPADEIINPELTYKDFNRIENTLGFQIWRVKREVGNLFRKLFKRKNKVENLEWVPPSKNKD